MTFCLVLPEAMCGRPSRLCMQITSIEFDLFCVCLASIIDTDLNFKVTQRSQIVQSVRYNYWKSLSDQVEAIYACFKYGRDH